MVDNEKFYKDVLRAKNILENFYFFQAMADEDIRNEYAQYGYKNYHTLREMLEKSCDVHIPVVLGINPNSKIFDHNEDRFVPMKIQRCLCCGKLLPFDLENSKSIDCIKYIENTDNITDYKILNRKYFELLDKFALIARGCNSKEETIENFREMIKNDYRTLEKSIKK